MFSVTSTLGNGRLTSMCLLSLSASQCVIKL